MFGIIIWDCKGTLQFAAYLSYDHSFIVQSIVITIVNYNHKTFLVQAIDTFDIFFGDMHFKTFLLQFTIW
jgi:hypothetical protein